MQQNPHKPIWRRSRSSEGRTSGWQCSGLHEKVLVELLMRNYAEVQGILIQPNKREEE
jgi:hypothetical protein